MPVTKAIYQVVSAIIDGGAFKATKYIRPTLTVKATRKLYGKKRRPSQKSLEVILTAGKPNYEERAFIKKLGKAGEPFPVKKVQMKMPK